MGSVALSGLLPCARRGSRPERPRPEPGGAERDGNGRESREGHRERPKHHAKTIAPSIRKQKEKVFSLHWGSFRGSM